MLKRNVSRKKEETMKEEMNRMIEKLQYRLARYKYMENGAMCQYLNRKIRILKMQGAEE